MTIHVLVVSHNHGHLIQQIGALAKLATDQQVNVHIKNNHPDPTLIRYTRDNNINMVNDAHGLGFGANNNYLFTQLYKQGCIAASDYIVILNPDVDVSNETLIALISEMRRNNDQLATLNLFRDYERHTHDPSIRTWPCLTDFFYSCLGAGNKTLINKKMITNPAFVDWAAGSFLAFTAPLYRRLAGFDERYFMYCEDVDICFRASKMGVKVKYYPHLCAVHLATHANRKFLSRHFFWHIKSALRFCSTRSGDTNAVNVTTT